MTCRRCSHVFAERAVGSAARQAYQRCATCRRGVCSACNTAMLRQGETLSCGQAAPHEELLELTNVAEALAEAQAAVDPAAAAAVLVRVGGVCFALCNTGSPTNSKCRRWCGNSLGFKPTHRAATFDHVRPLGSTGTWVSPKTKSCERFSRR